VYALRGNFGTISSGPLALTDLRAAGGASLGMYHFGVIRALFLQGLLPRVLSGSSAGSIVMAIVGVRTTEELSEMCSAHSSLLSFACVHKFFDARILEIGHPSGVLKSDVLLGSVSVCDALSFQNYEGRPIEPAKLHRQVLGGQGCTLQRNQSGVL
jgi:hypothetical protein